LGGNILEPHPEPNIFIGMTVSEALSDGFDVLEFLGNDLPPAVIFVTAYDQHDRYSRKHGATRRWYNPSALGLRR
jgi:hypothetical protein